MITARTAPGLAAVTAHGASWLSLAVYSFAATTVIFRMTGQAEYGVWAMIAAFRSSLLFLDGGLAFGVTRDAALAASGDADARRRWRASVILYVAGGAAVVLLGWSLAWVPATLLGLGPGGADVSTVTALVALETGLALVFSPVLASLRGTSRFDLVACSSFVTAGVGMALLFALVPTLGLIGAGIAVVLGRLAGGLTALALLCIRERTLIGARAQPRHFGDVLTFAVPMWAVAIGSAIGMATDVPIVGVMFGAEVAGAYGIGAVMPAVVAGLVFVLLDTGFPRLATLATASVGQVVRVLSTVGTLVTALGLGVIALSSADMLTVWLGSSSELTVGVTVAYAAVWMINVPTHVLVLAAIARDRHHLIGPIVIAEALVNVFLSVALALVVGPLGPAIATVATVGLTNLLVLPLFIGPRVGISPSRLMLPAIAAAVIGLVIAAVIRLPALLLTDPSARLVVHVVLSGLVIAMVGAATIARRTTVQRWLGILFDGGWRVLQAERTEKVAMTSVLAERSRGAATSPQGPLVTVRIATYNRGRLVAERAIASALAQTHTNIEVVVVGDHCDADTERAVREVRDPRVRFENMPIRGAYPDDPMFRWMVAGSAPMNRALALARGDWLAPLDDDDEFTPDHIEVLLDACLSRSLDVAYGIADMEVCPGAWEPVGSWPPEPGKIIHASVLYSLALRPMEHSIDSWRLNEPGDWNLWRRMIAAGARFGFVDRVVVRHYLEYRDVLAEAAL